MSNVKINYKSTVTIGGFNPTILTPDFLRECCSYKSEHTPKGQTTPVLTEIKFGNVHFLMELNKFQIQLLDIKDFSELFPLDLIEKYLDVLQYTPLKLFGINLNYSVYDINIDHVVSLLKDPFSVGSNLGIVPYSVLLGAKKPNGDGLSLNELTIVHQIDNDIKNSIKFSVKTDCVTINNNFEVDRLESDRTRTKLLTSRYEEILSKNDELLKKLE